MLQGRYSLERKCNACEEKRKKVETLVICMRQVICTNYLFESFDAIYCILPNDKFSNGIFHRKSVYFDFH